MPGLSAWTPVSQRFGIASTNGAGVWPWLRLDMLLQESRKCLGATHHRPGLARSFGSHGSDRGERMEVVQSVPKGFISCVAAHDGPTASTLRGFVYVRFYGEFAEVLPHAWLGWGWGQHSRRFPLQAFSSFIIPRADGCLIYRFNLWIAGLVEPYRTNVSTRGLVLRMFQASTEQVRQPSRLGDRWNSPTATGRSRQVVT